MKPKNKVQLASPISIRPGEGVVLNLVRLPTEDGQLHSFQMNLHDASVPDRRYTSDFCHVVDDVDALEQVKIMFGARKPIGDGLMSLLVLQMPLEGVRQFVESLEAMKNTEAARAKYQPAKVSEDLLKTEPDQTVVMTANLVAAAYAGSDACMDFYYASPFSVMKVVNSSHMAVDPVVRVSAPVRVFFMLWEALSSICQAHPKLKEKS